MHLFLCVLSSLVKVLLLISANFPLYYSKFRCEIRKFAAKFNSSFQNLQAGL